MAVKFVRGMLMRVSKQVVNQKLVYTISPLAGHVQVREIRVRRRIEPIPWLLKKERKYYEENLTKESKDFIQEVIKHKYLEPKESPLKEALWEKGQFEEGSRRTGLIARKIGVYPMWTKSGRRLLTTLLQVVDNHVIQYHTPEVAAATENFEKKKRRYGKFGCLVVGAESADPQKFTAAYNGLFTAAGVMPKQKLTKFYITPNARLQPGTPLYATHFRVGDYVDVAGITIDHGFQGVMKRWGFKGGRERSCTKSHRRPGCIGGGVIKKVWKGTKMPGFMGLRRRVLGGLKVWRINTKYNVIWVNGPAVPGPTHGYVYIYDSGLYPYAHSDDNHPPFPTYFSESETEPLPEEFYDPELQVFSDPTITFDDEEQVAKVKKN